MNIFRACLLLVMLSFSAVSWGSDSALILCQNSCSYHGWSNEGVRSCSQGCSDGKVGAACENISDSGCTAYETCVNGRDNADSSSKYKRGFYCYYEDDGRGGADCTDSDAEQACSTYE